MERLSAWLLSGAIRTLGLLSLDGQRRVGRWLGRAAWYLRIDGARVTRTNLAACFPDLDRPTRRRLARQSLEHTAMTVAESGAIYGWPEDENRGQKRAHFSTPQTLSG